MIGESNAGGVELFFFPGEYVAHARTEGLDL
jgi:hypothetical protein